MDRQLPADELVTALKSAAEPTRLRILMLLRSAELNVKDLTVILGQSQPRLSRHLKLLNEAGLIERFREGSWVYFFISTKSTGGRLARQILDMVVIDDEVLARDIDRADALKREREAQAQAYFESNVSEWDRIRAQHVDETAIETALLSILGDKKRNLLVDLGTGTGRMLDLLSSSYDQGLGIDVNHAMLGYARSKLSRQGLKHAQVRHGDIYNLAIADGAANVVVMHQVLHFLSEPQKAIAEAARILAPGGQLVVVDFAPHGLETLRDAQAHDRLGFPQALMSEWLGQAGLDVNDIIEVCPHSTRETTRDSEATEKLTVSLWVATQKRQHMSDQAQTKRHVLEEAQT